MNIILKLIRRVMVFSLVLTFYLISPLIATGETNEQEVVEPEIIMGQTNQPIDLGNGLRLLEGIYLFGVNQDNKLIVDLLMKI